MDWMDKMFKYGWILIVIGWAIGLSLLGFAVWVIIKLLNHFEVI